MKKLVTVLSAVLIVSLVLGACASGPAESTEPSAAPAAEGDSPVVGLVMKSLANEFFKIMEEGAVKYAEEDGTFELIPVGMNSETDIDTQISAMENFITQGVDLICVAPADSVGLVAPTKQAIDAGITVVNFDVKLDDTALADAGLEGLLFVGPDNEEGAYMSGEALAQELGEGGKVIIIEGNPGADNAQMRKAGFDRAVEQYNLELLESTTAHWETEEANTVMTNLLTRYPDVQGVMAANDSMALGVVKALDAAGMSGDVLVVGFDNIPAAQDLIAQGKMLATIDQFGPDMAVNCIKTGFSMIAGEDLTGWSKTPIELVTAAELTAEASAPAAEGEAPVVGLVMKSLANEFFKIMEEGAVKYAEEDGTFELIPVGMNSETDIDTQISAMENFITQGVDLICVAPADSVGLVAPTKRAIDAGITVVNFDVKLDDTALADVGLEDLLFVGPDNEEGAFLSGESLAQELGEGGKVIIIEGNPGADNAQMRKAGFDRAVEQYNLELLDSTTAHWETEEANTVMTNLLTRYPDVQGVMAANDSMALGVVKALDAAGMSGDVLVVGFDNIPAAQDLITQGKMLATIDQFGPDMAVNCIKTGFSMIAGEDLTGWSKTPIELVTAAELGE